MCPNCSAKPPSTRIPTVKAYEHGVRKPEGVRVEVVDISAYPGKTVKDFPEIDEYIADMEAFDDADLDVYLEFLQNERNKENEKQKENAS